MKTFAYNRDVKRRDSLLEYPDIREYGGIHYFHNLSGETLQKLIDERFADPDDKQNDAPTIKEFLEWLKKNPDYKAHGYAVSLERGDYRISIEGVDGCATSIDALAEFCNKFHLADEFRVTPTYQRCWYD